MDKLTAKDESTAATIKSGCLEDYSRLVQFPEPCSLGERQWGTEELLFALSNRFTVKRITMHQGAKGGLQYHHKKDEGGYVVFGRLIIRFDPSGNSGQLDNRVVEAGDSFWFPQGAVHQAEAITDCCYIEVSTPYLNDRVHCEADYAIEEEAGGLPSTKIEEVVSL